MFDVFSINNRLAITKNTKMNEFLIIFCNKIDKNENSCTSLSILYK